LRRWRPETEGEFLCLARRFPFRVLLTAVTAARMAPALFHGKHRSR
jgi:hypothetical protein